MARPIILRVLSSLQKLMLNMAATPTRTHTHTHTHTLIPTPTITIPDEPNWMNQAELNQTELNQIEPKKQTIKC
jgi:hypothetical protein